MPGRDRKKSVVARQGLVELSRPRLKERPCGECVGVLRVDGQNPVYLGARGGDVARPGTDARAGEAPIDIVRLQLKEMIEQLQSGRIADVHRGKPGVAQGQQQQVAGQGGAVDE